VKDRPLGQEIEGGATFLFGLPPAALPFQFRQVSEMLEDGCFLGGSRPLPRRLSPSGRAKSFHQARVAPRGLEQSSKWLIGLERDALSASHVGDKLAGCPAKEQTQRLDSVQWIVGLERQWEAV
jgi:hypothetical protein